MAGVEYPQGRTFGRPHDVEGQMAVLRGALEALVQIKQPGGRIDLPVVWPEPRSKVQTHGSEPAPISTLIKKKPWLLKRFIDLDPPF